MKLKLLHLWPLLAYIAAVAIGTLYLPVEIVSGVSPFVGFVGATFYVVLFSTRNWKAEPFTRAMMLQGFTLWLIFLQGIIRLVLTNRPAATSADGLLVAFNAWAFNLLILTAIWWKVIALYQQIRKGYLDELARY